MIRLVSLLILFSLPALAEEADQATLTLPGAQECAVDLPPEGPSGGAWTTAEHWAWERICLGEVAAMSLVDGYDGLPCKPTEIEEAGDAVPATRVLRPEFVQLILTREPWVSAPVKRKVYIQCARIERRLDLENQHVRALLAIDSSHLPGGANLLGARFDRTLSFQGSVFGASLQADGLQVEGSVDLRGGAKFKKVLLLGARIGDNLDATGSEFDGLFRADGLQVGGGVFLSGGAKFKEVVFIGARIGGTLNAVGSEFDGSFRADRLQVEGGVFLHGGAKFKEVRLVGARIGGNLSAIGSEFDGLFGADGLQVEGGVLLRGGAKFKEVRLVGARIGGDLSAIGSKFDGLFGADGLQVEGSVLLRGGAKFKGVWLAGARIDDNLEADGSEFDGLFQADGLQVEGNVFLRDGAKFKDVRLVGARIGGDLVAIGSEFDGLFQAGGLQVEGNVLLRGGAKFKGVWLAGASIGGDLSAIGSEFDGLFQAGGLQVGGSVYLRGGATFKEIRLIGARVGRHLQLAGSNFAGTVNLTGATIGELVLFLTEDPVWGDDARLILRNAVLGALQSRPQSWQRGEDDWIEAELTGLSYDHLGGFRAGDENTLIDAEASTLIDWIEKTRPASMARRYDPGPYEQLAAVLTAEGLAARADAVLYAKFKRRSAVPPKDTPWWERAIAWPLSRGLVGYGIYPSRSGYGFVLLVLFGVCLAYFSSGLRQKGLGYRVWYSVDLALPVINLKNEHKDIEHDRLWVESLYHLQKLLGIVIATYLVGALTLLGS